MPRAARLLAATIIAAIDGLPRHRKIARPMCGNGRDHRRQCRHAPQAISAEGLARAELQAMWMVPRHPFEPKDVQPLAYEDRPLPIGYTFSEPFIDGRFAPGQKLNSLGGHPWHAPN